MSDEAGRSADSLITIGLPVFNGRRFLQAAAGALLGQTEADLELVICDSGSTDGSIEIARSLAAADPRVRAITNTGAVSAPANFNAAFASCRGRYFKWAADDDLHLSTYVERCIEALESEPDAVLAHSRAESIDAGGRVLRPAWGHDPDLGSPDPVVRFRAALARPTDPIPLQMFAVIRPEVLRRTGLLEPIPEYDLALVAELALYGRFVQLDEVLFQHQEHSERMGPMLAADSARAATVLGGSSRLPHWRLLRRHLDSIRRRPPGVPARPLLAVVARWALRRRSDLTEDLFDLATTLPWVGTAGRRLQQRRHLTAYRRLQKQLEQTVVSSTPAAASLVLVDADELALTEIEGRTCRPLQPMDSADGSIPATADAMIAALDRCRHDGCDHLVIAWPARWVLDYHRGFAGHLDQHHRLVADTDHGLVYQLAPNLSGPSV